MKSNFVLYSALAIGLALALAVHAFAAADAKLPDTSRMNVLFIITEDTNAGVWGCNGNPICKTPNIDRFAAGAVLFESAYVQAVCCNPTRTSFLTGLRPLSTGVWSNGQVMQERLPAGALTLPEYLKKKDFSTAVIGKFFHLTEYAEKQLLAFDRIEMYPKPPNWKGPGPILAFTPVKRPQKDPAPADRNSKEFRLWRTRQSDRYGDSGIAPEEEGDYRIAKTACALLKDFAQTKKRFFLSVHQTRPHTPLIAPKKYIAMYDPAKIPDPPAPPSSLKGCPYPKRVTGGNPDIFTKEQPTPQQAKEAIAAYYACMSFVDDNIGMILDALDKEGLAGNTIVFILGDHGFHLGDHGFWSKYSMLEETRRAPLAVRVPGAPGNGKVCREFVEFVDFVPTVGELAGLDLPANLEGTSFAPLLANPDQPWKKAVFMVESPDNQVVRTKKFSYMELKNGPVPVALYDLEKDPWETINMADDPAYSKNRKEMAELLKAGWKAALPDRAAAKR
ncbi:MAG: sulfatase [Candidatus Sumerlaeota bacterium]|nr:sulfatase [Candidatus Sumerlaeota bacterium]